MTPSPSPDTQEPAINTAPEPTSPKDPTSKSRPPSPEVFILYHSINGRLHCDDGFGAAFVAYLYFAKFYPDLIRQKKIVFVPEIYGEPVLSRSGFSMRDFKGATVYFLDYTPKQAELRKVIGAASKVFVLDHHKSAEAELTPLRVDYDKKRLHLTFDMEHSGAILAWDYFFGSDEGSPTAPDLLFYIEDGDLYKFELERSRDVQAGLRSYPQDFETWMELLTKPIETLAAEGQPIRRFLDLKVQELTMNARLVNIDGYIVPAVACPKLFASDLGNELCKLYPGHMFSATYEDGATVRTYSLRSKDSAPDANDAFDVSAVAMRMGGGGHRRAAGFQVPIG